MSKFKVLFYKFHIFFSFWKKKIRKVNKKLNKIYSFFLASNIRENFSEWFPCRFHLCHFLLRFSIFFQRTELPSIHTYIHIKWKVFLLPYFHRLLRVSLSIIYFSSLRKSFYVLTFVTSTVDFWRKWKKFWLWS